MRIIALGPVKTGISRLREKGGASPQSLFECLNGYVTEERSIRSRAAARWALGLPPAATKGLMVYRGKFLVFASEPVVATSPEYAIEILKHPDSESTATIKDIHFAAPFLGYPYVVAEWTDGVIKHYWLQAAETWQADHVYREGQVVIPTVPNGYGYRATRLGGAAQKWAPGVARAVGDKVEPTTASGYEHTVVEVIGDNPRSGTVEPAWATAPGGVTHEDADDQPVASGGSSGGGTSLPPEVEDRYGSSLPRGGGSEFPAVAQ